MSHDIVTFNVSIGGYWVKTHDEEFSYVGGESRTIECVSQEILGKLETEVNGGLYGHKVWYKMPFEYCKDRKVLCDGDESFQMMCEAAIWSKVINLFVVNLAEHLDDVVSYENDEVEARFERNAELVEESEDFDYHDTPTDSDSDSDSDEDNEDFIICERGSGVLKLRQVFNNLDKFKEALVDYVLKERWNIKLDRWGKDKSGAKCSSHDCSWGIYCSYEVPIGKWMVKRYEPEHSCIRDGYSKILKTAVIAKLFLGEIRSDPEIKPKTIQEQLHQRYSLFTTIDKCRKAKIRALQIIQKDESPTKRVLRRKRIMHCGRCGVVGHNATKCKNVGVQISRGHKRVNKLSGHTREDE